MIHSQVDGGIWWPCWEKDLPPRWPVVLAHQTGAERERERSTAGLPGRPPRQVDTTLVDHTTRLFLFLRATFRFSSLKSGPAQTRPGIRTYAGVGPESYGGVWGFESLWF